MFRTQHYKLLEPSIPERILNPNYSADQKLPLESEMASFQTFVLVLRSPTSENPALFLYGDVWLCKFEETLGSIDLLSVVLFFYVQ